MAPILRLTGTGWTSTTTAPSLSGAGTGTGGGTGGGGGGTGGGGTGGGTGPLGLPTSSSTVTGFNTALGGILAQSDMDARIVSFGGRVSCGRGYEGGTSLSPNGSDWTTAGGSYLRLTGQHPTQKTLGIASDGRLNINARLAGGSKNNPGANYASLIPTQSRIDEVVNWVIGWFGVTGPWPAAGAHPLPFSKVWVGDHEFNGYYWDTTTPDQVIVAFNAAVYQIAWRIYDWQVANGWATAGQPAPVTFIVNTAQSNLTGAKFRTNQIPDAVPGATSNSSGGNPYAPFYGTTTLGVTWASYAPGKGAYRGMPPGTLVGSDSYDNPSAAGTNVAAYASPYGSERKPNQNLADLDLIVAKAAQFGYFQITGGGWMIGETNAPQRVAPRLPATLMAAQLSDAQTKLRWAAPNDTSARDADADGSRRQAAFIDEWVYAQNIKDPSGVVRPCALWLWWVQQNGTSWNQGFDVVGAAAYDDWSNASGVRVQTPILSGTSPATLAQVKAMGYKPGPLNQGWPAAARPESLARMNDVVTQTCALTPSTN